MKPEKVRTTVESPSTLYRRLKQKAAAQGCSACELILRGVEKVLLNHGNQRVTGSDSRWPTRKAR